MIDHRRETRVTAARVRAQLETATVIGFGRSEVVERGHVRALQPGIGIVAIDGQRLFDELPTVFQRAREALLPVFRDIVLREEDLGLSLTHVGRGELRVEPRGLLEMLDRSLRIDDPVFREQAAALQEREVGLEVGRSLAAHALNGIAVDAQFQGPRHLHGNLVLDCEYVPRKPVEAHRPHVGTGFRVDQLCRDPHPVAIALHAAFQQVTGAELAADLARVHGPLAKRERGRPGDDVELRKARQLVHDGFGDSRGEDVAFGSRAQVLEGQHRDCAPSGVAASEARLSDHECRNRREQHPDDHDVQVAAQPVHDRARNAFRLGVARYSPVARLVEPGERHGHRKADQRGDDQRHHHPARHAERLEGDVGDLQQQPGDDRIARRDADHAALTQAMQPTSAGGPRHVRCGA